MSKMCNADALESRSVKEDEEARPLNQPMHLVKDEEFNTRLCKKACWSLAIVSIGVFLGLFVFFSHVEETPKNMQKWFPKGVSNESIANHLRELTKKPHVAGTSNDLSTAEYVLRNFQSFGLKTHSVDYKVLLSYPSNISIYLHVKNHTHQIVSDSAKSDDDIIPPFHAYSPSGTLEGEVVYVNYGSPDDYERLMALQVNVSGAIVMARYGDEFRGHVVKRAAKNGAVAAIMYNDPQQFGGNTTKGYFPNSKWLPSDGAQRGTVMDGIGDPTTQGFASVENAERMLPSKDRFPSIPSIPISAQNAEKILNSLQGPAAPNHWQGSVGLSGSYRVGRGPALLKFNYKENQTIGTIRNVIAEIEGSEEPDRYVILGNHRDAWVYGGVDPNSGTAALLEIARNFGTLLTHGWRPKRSIILCSWDGEEYGMIGSTEWVEQNKENLGAKAIAYINVDCAVQGSGIFAGASPQLDSLLVQVTKQVQDPEFIHKTVHDSWIAMSNSMNPQISRLGEGASDFVAFLQHAGVPSMDLYYGKDFPVYHTRYDSFEWMQIFGDPLFQRHVAVATIWGLVALRLADDVVLPLEYVTYADELQRYAETVKKTIQSLKLDVNMQPMFLAIQAFSRAAESTSVQAKKLINNSQAVLKIRALNDRLMLTERAFLDCQGLPGKHWFKHLIYGPFASNQYGLSSFPGIVDALDKNKSGRHDEDGQGLALTKQEVQHQIWRVARRITQATSALSGSFT